MDTEPLQQSAWRRAKYDTRKAFYTIRFWLVEGIVGALLTVFVLLWQPSWASQGTVTIFYQVLVPIGGVFTGLGLVFLVIFIKAPYRQRDEARKQLIGKAAIDDILNELGSLRAEGVGLRDDARHEIKNEEQLEHWKIQEGAWRNKLIDTVRKLSPVDASFIETINEFEMHERHRSIGDLTLQTGIINERLKRLEDFMKHHQR